VHVPHILAWTLAPVIPVVLAMVVIALTKRSKAQPVDTRDTMEAHERARRAMERPPISAPPAARSGDSRRRRGPGDR
jgi:hypothetical protein